MITTSFIFTPPQHDPVPLRMTGKRYRRNSAVTEDGLTLVFAHGSGFHKECWEPVIENLFNKTQTIREAWALDWQTHGDAALLNQNVIEQFTEPIGIAQWASGIAHFVRSGYLNGHKVIMIGHSAGASAIMYSTKLFLPSQIPYHAIILVEPPLIDRDVYYANLQKQERDIKRVSKAIAAGKSTWKSSEAAFEWMKSRQPWKNWDSRVLQIYIAHGLYTSLDNSGAEFVTVKCPKQREIDGFNDIASTFDATDCIGDACKTVPIHIIFGAINDLMPIYGQKSLFDTSKGRIIQSVAKLPGVGHMIVQEKPDLLSTTLDALIQKLSHSSHRL